MEQRHLRITEEIRIILMLFSLEPDGKYENFITI